MFLRKTSSAYVFAANRRAVRARWRDAKSRERDGDATHGLVQPDEAAAVASFTDGLKHPRLLALEGVHAAPRAARGESRPRLGLTTDEWWVVGGRETRSLRVYSKPPCEPKLLTRGLRCLDRVETTAVAHAPGVVRHSRNPPAAAGLGRTREKYLRRLTSRASCLSPPRPPDPAAAQQLPPDSPSSQTTGAGSNHVIGQLRTAALPTAAADVHVAGRR